MKVDVWLSEATKQLKASGIGTARLDALVLLEDVTKKDRAWLLSRSELELTNIQTRKLDGLVKRRSGHEPLAYIRGKTEFYGREFIINKYVLEPRPESETFFDVLKNLDLTHVKTMVDVGTGSGALAITAKLEFPNLDVIATDIDSKCLEVASQNAKKHKTGIEFIQTDLIKSLKLPEDSILICNLPYVPDGFTINQAAMNEPKLAIFGGPDGLDVYRKLFEQIKDLKFKPKYVLTESPPSQHKALVKIAKTYGYNLTKTEDFIQVFSY